MKRTLGLWIGLMLVGGGWGQAPQIRSNTAGAGAKAADIEAAVRLICPAGKMTRAKDGSVSGCGVCPRGTDFEGDPRSNWEMYAETPGHFTAAADENLVLDGTGCDSHAANFGGSFVFALSAGKMRLMRYDKGLITEECLKFAYASGRDGLVCRGGWAGQGEADGSVLVVTFDATGNAKTSGLIGTMDTTGTCGDDGSQMVQESAVEDFGFEAMADNGAAATGAGLTVKATLRHVSCGQMAAEKKIKKTASATKSFAIDFIFDGKQFRVAPASRAALAKFAASAQ